MRLSIRWRLTVWNTLALAVVLLGFAALVYGLLRHALYEQTDRQLRAAWQQIDQDRRLASEPDARLRHWLHELAEHNLVLGVVYDPNGRVWARTPELAGESVPPAPPPGPVRLRDAVVPVLERQRLLEGRLRVGDEDCAVVLLASLAEADRELSRLLAALLMAVPLALAGSAGLGYLLARKALAPLERLRRSTRAITADRLDRRLPVANPGDELGRLAQTINEMIGRLERSFAEVHRFTADASHELRTPLTAIRTEAEVALARPAPPEQRHLLGSILEECERLTRLTDQLLALAREDTGSTPSAREPVDVAALVEGVAETLRPVAEARGVRLHTGVEGPVWVRGDGARLRQVVINVLDNALKYTPEGGTVGVCVEVADGAAAVVVRDTGEGIPPEHLPRVFDRFYRIDKARAREQGGTGLGLSIARSIVTAHGGRIDLDSVPGRGTTCTVALPLQIPE